MRTIFYICLFFLTFTSFGQGTFQLAVLKYAGGGDYYANPTSLPNLAKYMNEHFGMNISEEVPYVEVGSPKLFNYPFIHMTGHGNVVFSLSEAENLRNYLLGGGFLHIDDNYGMDEFVRTEIKKVFPDQTLVEIPHEHPIFKQSFTFTGLPKIHEHDDQRPQAFAIFHDGRMVLLYTFETDLGDGWEDESVHNDSAEKREAAFRMGANILEYVFLNGAIE
jgi:hypothetical protein